MKIAILCLLVPVCDPCNTIFTYFKRHSIFLYLFIQELPGVLLDVSLIQVCGETHKTHFRQTEISEFNVTHGRDEQTDGEKQTEIM